MKRLQQQDHRAIADLYDKYAPALYGCILRDVQNQPMAEQILEHAFVTIWNNAGNYNPCQTRLFIWMVSIYKGEAISQLNRLNRTI